MVQRKVFSILAAVFVLMLCVVPASAANDESSENPTFRVFDYQNAGLLIDYVIINDGPFAGSIVNWPFNFWQPGNSYSYSMNNAFLTGGGSKDSFNASCVFSGATSVSLVCSTLFFSDTVEFTVGSDFENVRFTNISVCGYLEVPNQADYFSEYVIDQYLFDHTRDFVDDGVLAVNIAGVLGHAVNETKILYELPEPAVGSMYSMRNVIITLDYYIDAGTAASPVLMFAGNTGLYGNGYVKTWLSRWELSTVLDQDPVAVDVSEWLSTSIGAFLSFEIAPGFSLDSLLWLGIIICFFLFFVRIFT